MNQKITLRVLRATVGLVGAVWLAASGQAAVIFGFNDFFDPTSPNWTITQDKGAVFFTNANSQLYILGPTGLASPSTSFDSADYVPLPVDGTIKFHWTFYAGDATSATAQFYDSLNGTTVLASGGTGTTNWGEFTVSLQAGDEFAFGLNTDMVSGKKNGSQFIITPFEFDFVPEASTAIAGGLLVLFCTHHYLRRILPRRETMAP
jgi:hypothetical protein